LSYVDLHLHLLPGIDDGSRDRDEALAYARRMAIEGVREAVVTPHICNDRRLDPEQIAPLTAELQEAIDAEGIGVRLHPGGELHPRRAASLSETELELLAQGPPGRRWLLLEAPFAGVDQEFCELTRELQRRGFGVLIAHPERAAGPIDEALAQLAPALEHGALIQVNVCSLLGNHGLYVQEAAAGLLRAGQAHVLASDAHPGSREHTVRLGFELALRAGASSVQAWRLTQANPRFLLRGGMRSTLPAPTRVAA
jgi:protein-tyrosine phosphatase